MRKQILKLLFEFNPTDIHFFRGDGNSVNWGMRIEIGGNKRYVCYGYYVGNPNGKNEVINEINRDILNKFKGY